MKKSVSVLSLVACVALLFPGCMLLREKHKVGNASHDGSLVYGYIDPAGLPREFNGMKKNFYRVIIKQFSPKVKNDYIYHAAVSDEKGLFWISDLKAGSYAIVEFNDGYSEYCLPSFLISSPENYWMLPDYNVENTAFKVDSPGIYFTGSFKYRTVKKQTFASPGIFELERDPNPNHKELLGRLVKLSKNSRWHTALQKVYDKYSGEGK